MWLAKCYNAGVHNALLRDLCWRTMSHQQQDEVLDLLLEKGRLYARSKKKWRCSTKPIL